MNDPTKLAERHASLTRRKFFRNVGACIALPAFESLYALPAFAGGKAAPTRMAFVYVPNGQIPGAFWPSAVPDGPGDHARAGGTFLTNQRVKKTAGSDIQAAVSIDQVVAGQIGHLTR